MAKRKVTLTAEDLGIGEDSPRLSLRELFSASASSDTEMQRPVMVPVEDLLDNPYQPRLDMDEESLEELTAVIKQQGFQGVLVARPHPDHSGSYQLTAGHRRREAAHRAGLKVLPVVLQELTDEEMVVRAITENIQREDLSPLEEGRIYLLMQEEMGFTLAGVAKEVGKGLGYVRNRLRVAQAPLDVQDMVRARPDTLHAVTYLVRVDSEILRAEVIGHLMSGTVTNQDLAGYIEGMKQQSERQASGEQIPVSEVIADYSPESDTDVPVPLPEPTSTSSMDTPDTATALSGMLSNPGNSSETLLSGSSPKDGSGGAVPAIIEGDTSASVADGGAETGPLLVPKADGSGTLIVVKKEKEAHPESVHLSPRTSDGQRGQQPLVPEITSPQSAQSYPDPIRVPYEIDGRSHFRVRRSKLASSLRALLSYRGLVRTGDPLPEEEHEYLSRIIAMAVELRGDS